MRALKYGRGKATRAPRTAAALPASREKNHTPGTPSRWTYVLTLSSWDSLKYGSGGANAALTPHMVNGVMPAHARPPRGRAPGREGGPGRGPAAPPGEPPGGRPPRALVGAPPPGFWPRAGGGDPPP